MKRTHTFPTLCVTALLSTGALVATGCGGSDTQEASREAGAGTDAEQQPAQAAQGMPEHGQDLTVTGCLTANIDGSSYAITPTPAAATGTMASAVAPRAGGATTFTYELVGNAEDFRRHANTVVTIRGREDASVSRDVEHERETEGPARGAANTDDAPKVEVKEEAEVEVRRLHATSVVGTGDTCPSYGPTGGSATEPATPGGATTPGASGAPKGGTSPRPGGGSQ